jgi:hypothetical protein
MLRKAGPVVTAVLAFGLLLTVRRLSDAQARLERMRIRAGAAWADDEADSAFTAVDAADLAREWEQGVAPMDS